MANRFSPVPAMLSVPLSVDFVEQPGNATIRPRKDSHDEVFMPEISYAFNNGRQIPFLLEIITATKYADGLHVLEGALLFSWAIGGSSWAMMDMLSNELELSE